MDRLVIHDPQPQPEPPPDLMVTTLVKGDERYIWIYPPDRWRDTFPTIGRFAADPELDFTWYDAAQLTQRIRILAEHAV